MESVAARATTSGSRWRVSIDSHILGIWALAGGLVLYLGLDGGGYDLVVRNQVGIVVWWLVIVGAVFGLLPAARLTRTATVALALLGSFVVWTAIASTWSLSSENSLNELSRVTCYLGVLVLAVAVHRDRELAVRHTVRAIASAVAVVAGIAVLSRLRPELFPAAKTTVSFLPGAHGRLSWPLNYWNALAALVALGIPLLLAVATSARTLAGQSIAAAALPLTALCGYLTFSRGGAIATTVAVLAFMALAPERIPKLGTLLLGAFGSAVLIAGAIRRHAIEQGLTNSSASHQGASLLVVVILVCAGVGVAQAGIGLAARHGTLPRWFQISPRRARLILAGAIVVGLIAALLAGAPAHLSHVWRDFKRSNPEALHQNSISRFSVVSGNGRYALWKVAVASTHGHLLGGSGPGTFQLLWLPRAPYYSYVVNAHSLYLETLDEVGLVGLAFLVGFLAFALGTGIRLVTRTRFRPRAEIAAVTAACLAFAVAAAFDWDWQMPVLPAAVLLLVASLLAPARRTTPPAEHRFGPWIFRALAIVAAVLSLIMIGIPLATTKALRSSQTAAAEGNTQAALTDARTAIRLEPGAASPQLQAALVLEVRHDLKDAIAAARRATRDESENWQPWLVLSRLEIESGDTRSGVAAFRRARKLNPTSPLLKK